MKRFYYTDIDTAQCVQDAITFKNYTAEWLKSLPSDAPETEKAEVIVIDEVEYNELLEQLKDGEEVPYIPSVIPEESDSILPDDEIVPETPLTIQQMREKIKQQDAAIDMLTECLLEMSEEIYNK